MIRKERERKANLIPSGDIVIHVISYDAKL